MLKKSTILVIAIIILGISSSLTYEQQTIIPTLKHYLAAKPFESLLSLLQIPYWGKIVSVETVGYFKFIEFLVRKLTHFIGFGIIAIILYWFLPQGWKYKGRIVFACIFVIAIVDEFRQQFTPGRLMSWQDVFVDVAGACFFLAILLLRKKYSSITPRRN